MSPTRHPSRRRLQKWLDGSAPRRVDRHIERCEVCQSSLEQLSSLDDALVADLGEVLAPPHDLTDRTTDGVYERLRDEAAFGAFLDLFTIGWDVTRTVMDPDSDLTESASTDDDVTQRDEPQTDAGEADETEGERS